MSTDRDIKKTVREKYSAEALGVARGRDRSCCGDTDDACCSPVTANLYNEGETAGLPTDAVQASLGCGNPTALAELQSGEVVLDLGSGGGLDVFLAARHVGPTGKVYGLDMTDEMLALARRNQVTAGVDNVEFLKGEIERIPLPDESVDVVISNCVINLSGDKSRVISEAFRVLRPGGRFAVSDVVVRGQLPPDLRRNMELWVGCIAGALEESTFSTMLADTGFEDVRIEPTRVYRADDARAFLSDTGVDVELVASEIGGRIMGAFIRARKPNG